uniref:Integrase catalytic domain-containing protein n=1 Tax=Strongyloides venezuelensis TaxID=75913 RepID=A0A0K0FS45_STRVS
MLRRVRSMFVAVSIRKWIVATHMKCDLCQRYGSSRPRTIHSWPPTTSNNQRWHMDIGTTDQVSFLACVDVHCNWIMAARIKNHTPSEITKKLLLFFEHNGCPLFLVSDNFPSFKDVSFCTLLKGKGITPFYSPPYTPQSNGPIERCMKILKDGMAKSSLSTFDQRLQEAVINHHNGSTDVDGKSPNQRRLQVLADYHIINDISYEKVMNHSVWFKTPNMTNWEEGIVTYQLSKDIFIVRTKDDKEMVIKGCHLKDRLKTETSQTIKVRPADPRPPMTIDSSIDSEPTKPVLLDSRAFQLRGGRKRKMIKFLLVNS